LELDVVNTGDNPTIYNLSGNTIQITEGANFAVSLISGRVAASDLTFQNLSKHQLIHL